MPQYTFMMTPEGRLPEGIKGTLANALRSFAGKKVRITLVEAKETASLKQLRYYRGIVVPMFMEHFAKQGLIFDNNTMHDQMMRGIGGFSNPYVNAFTGEPDCGRISYVELPTAQAEGYHHLCRMWAASAKPEGFQVPMPNENLDSYFAQYEGRWK